MRVLGIALALVLLVAVPFGLADHGCPASEESVGPVTISEETCTGTRMAESFTRLKIEAENISVHVTLVNGTAYSDYNDYSWRGIDVSAAQGASGPQVAVHAGYWETDPREGDYCWATITGRLTLTTTIVGHVVESHTYPQPPFCQMLP